MPHSLPAAVTTLVSDIAAIGRAEDAVPILKQLLPGEDDVAEAYVGALAATDRKAEALVFLRARSRYGRP